MKRNEQSFWEWLDEMIGEPIARVRLWWAMRRFRRASKRFLDRELK